jgi:hypothetical protein
MSTTNVRTTSGVHLRYGAVADPSQVSAKYKLTPLTPQQRKRLVGIETQDIWHEVAVGGGAWIAAYRLFSQNGTPVIGEVRLFPKPEEWPDAQPPPGSWGADLLGARAQVPHGGVTHRLLRELKVGLQDKDMAQVFETFRSMGIEAPPDQASAAAPRSPTGRRRGRKPFPDRFYAEVARDYVAAIDRGSDSPAADVARRRGWDREGRVRDILHEARSRGLLTPPPGVARHGGALTPKASALLDATANVPANVPAGTRKRATSAPRQPTRREKLSR